MTRRTRQEIEQEIQDLADHLLDAEPTLSDAEARSLIWEEFGDLYDEYRRADEGPRDEPIEKMAPEPTVADIVAEAVHQRADRLAFDQWPDRSVAEIRASLWLSDEGQRLYELSRSDAGKMPYTEARETVAKSLRHADTWAILDRWLR